MQTDVQGSGFGANVTPRASGAFDPVLQSFTK